MLSINIQHNICVNYKHVYDDNLEMHRRLFQGRHLVFDFGYIWSSKMVSKVRKRVFTDFILIKYA